MGDSPTGLVPDAAQQLTASDLDAYAAFALRTRSPFAREVLRAGGHTDVLGRVLALGGADGSHTRGLAVLDDAVAAGGVGSLRPEALSVWTSLLLRAGREDQLREVLAKPDLPLTDAERWVLRTDLANPHRTGAGLTGDALAAAERDWLAVLNEVHTPDGLEPVELVPPRGARHGLPATHHHPRRRRRRRPRERRHVGLPPRRRPPAGRPRGAPADLAQPRAHHRRRRLRPRLRRTARGGRGPRPPRAGRARPPAMPAPTPRATSRSPSRAAAG
ncbi:hypothetical protein B277_09059 [Janibacter hoylei PVAS-1]|uniref:Uncharacterized protein n=1 Tax=Janibacter hoylei PVAS-1 TaxID=1210046 RepID=K1E711_9MICO|nr:hypothetical protein [Janibacter hoylei]EKA61207.1 hypothetical protein B277_09059 [Janibacter hoylei PVAS-1]